MKNLFYFLLLVPFFGFSQYSNYYNVDVNSKSQVDVNANVNVNKNVNVSGNVYKTITSIDYGALRLANAQSEKNRLENIKYSNEIEKNRALEIATNPIKAFDYGTDNNWVMDKSMSEQFGFSKGTTWYHKIPHKSLLVVTEGYNYRNESIDGVITEIELGNAAYGEGQTSFKSLSKKEQQEWLNNNKKYYGETEKLIKENYESDYQPGKLIDEKYYTHKFEINKSKVYGQNGFVWSWFYEDDYEYVIKDNYICYLPNGVFISAGVRYKGDKDKVDFEMLEGRRSYLKRLNDQIIATTRITLGKKGLNN